MLNKFLSMGRLIADPELKTTQSGTSVCTFTIACERDFTPKGHEKQSDFINCVAWRQTGEFISKYFSKGRMIFVEGSLQSRKYQDKQGNNRTAYEIIVDHAYFGDSGNKQSAPAEQSATPATAKQSAQQAMMQDTSAQFEAVDIDDDSDDLPF